MAKSNRQDIEQLKKAVQEHLEQIDRLLLKVEDLETAIEQARAKAKPQSKGSRRISN